LTSSPHIVPNFYKEDVTDRKRSALRITNQSNSSFWAFLF
jgi:hypothetical protein